MARKKGGRKSKRTNISDDESTGTPYHWEAAELTYEEYQSQRETLLLRSRKRSEASLSYDEAEDTPYHRGAAEHTYEEDLSPRGVPSQSLRESSKVPSSCDEAEDADDQTFDPKPFEPIPAAAAAPPAKSRLLWKLPSLEGTSFGLRGIPIDHATSSKASSLRTKFHHKYDDQLVTLQVEDVLFRVSTNSLRVSPSFTRLLDRLGSHNTTPIKLQDVTVSQVESFLHSLTAKVFYGSSLDFGAEELTSILRLSTGWEFSEIRDWAIRRLSKVFQPAMKRLELAHIYRIKEWLEPAYFDLCARSAELSAEEISQVIDLIKIAGLKVLLKLREDYQRKKGEGVGYLIRLFVDAGPILMGLDADALKRKIRSSAALALRSDV